MGPARYQWIYADDEDKKVCRGNGDIFRFTNYKLISIVRCNQLQFCQFCRDGVRLIKDISTTSVASLEDYFQKKSPVNF